MIDAEELISEVATGTGTGRSDEARRALEDTLGMLARLLDPAEVRELAGELPRDLAETMRRRASADADEPGLPLALAVEYAQVTCRLLAARIGPDVRQLLARRLPAPWCELFARWPPAEEPPAHLEGHTLASAHADGHTVATGHPGSDHAVADHGLDDAQSESVARAANPHGDDKLSTGR